MALIPIEGLASIGLVQDIPAHKVPFNAWTSGKNVRFLDDSVQKARGHSSIATPAIAPYALFPAPVPGSLFWVYPGLAKVHAFIGTTDADITRVSSDYTAEDSDQWQGGTFNGVFYLNNGKDKPQIWTPQSFTTKLIDLTNWPASTLAKVLRPFKNYLIALDVSKSGTRYPRMIKWSHSAEPGTIPSSWDETDPTLDAGEFTLSEGYSSVVDCLPLGDLNLIYTEDEVWAQRYVGGTFVFQFFNLFRQVGIIAQGCVVNFLNQHFVLTQDDMITHNGSQITSRAEKRMRRWLFGKLTSTAYFTTRVIAHHLDREIWVCFSQGGGTALDTAIIWNWRDDTWAIRDLPDVRGLALVPQALIRDTGVTWGGTSESWSTITGTWLRVSETWEDLSGTWADPVGFGDTWGDPERSPYSQALLCVSPSRLKIVQVDDTLQFESTDFETLVEHTGLSVIGRDQYGHILSDPNVEKLVRGVIPRFSAEDGVIIDITIGSRQTPLGAVTWETPQQFTVGVDFKVDCYTVGRILALRFASYSDFKLQGYDLDIAPLGVL